MKIYGISQAINKRYDTFDSAVVCAENEEEARTIHPDGREWRDDDNDVRFNDWVAFSEIDKIEVKYIGEAGSDIKKGVIVSSFNAG